MPETSTSVDDEQPISNPDHRRANSTVYDAARAVEVAKVHLQEAIVNAVSRGVDYRLIDKAMAWGYDAGVEYRKARHG